MATRKDGLMQRPCGKWSETPCHIDCATVGEWNAANYDWAQRTVTYQETDNGDYRVTGAMRRNAVTGRYVVRTAPRRWGKTAALEAIQRQYEEGSD